MTSPPGKLPTLTKATVFATRDAENQHGLRLKLGEEGAILIYYIEPGSGAIKTDLCVGCEILSIDDHRVASVRKAEELLAHYMDKKGVVKILASKGDRPRGTKYVMVKNTEDKSVFDGESNVIDGLELEQRNGYIRVTGGPTSGFFSKVRLGRNDCIWSINGTEVQELNQLRHLLKDAEGKIVVILTYNGFLKLKTTVFANVACKKKDDGWQAVIGSLEKQPDKLEDMYDIHEKLGEGAFAVVKRATNKKTGGNYAVKIVNRSSLGGGMEAALKEEIAILSDLNHDHIMCLHNVFVTLNVYQLVTEFLEGGELFDRIVAKESYTEKEARDVCKVLFDALNFMAEKRVAHRDLKPENLLLQYKSSDSEIKIADFGFAKVSETEESLSTVCGTPGYVGPEVICKKKYGTKCDMWSMGVIVYILMGGYPPFYADNEKELYRITRMGDYEFHEESWSHISVGAKDLISELLQTDPKKRASAKDVLDHPWMKKDKKLLSLKSLAKSQTCLKSHLAKQRFKKAIHSVRFLQGFSGDAIFSGKKRTALNVED